MAAGSSTNNRCCFLGSPGSLPDSMEEFLMNATAKTLGTLVLALVVLALYFSIFVFKFFLPLYLALALAALGLITVTILAGNAGGDATEH